MATSNSTTYNNTAAEIITTAMEHCGQLAVGEVPSAEEYASGLRVLNQMVKTWQAEGLRLWKQEDLIVWLRVGVSKYSLSSSGDHAATTWARTTTSAAASSGASSITVSSITGISDGDNLGIVMDDGTLQWDTVNGTPTGSTVALTGTLDDDVASGNQVWAYTSKPPRPLKLHTPRRRNSANNDVPIWMVERSVYFGTPSKTLQSSPVNTYYDPQLTTGELHVWPAPSTVDDTLLFSARMPIEDFTVTTNNPDFPQEWLSCLSWNLADQIALSYEVPSDRHQRIMMKAVETKTNAEMWDVEEGSVQFAPDLS